MTSALEQIFETRTEASVAVQQAHTRLNTAESLMEKANRLRAHRGSPFVEKGPEIGEPHFDGSNEPPFIEVPSSLDSHGIFKARNCDEFHTIFRAYFADKAHLLSPAGVCRGDRRENPR